MYNEPLTPLYGNRPPRRSHKKRNIILALSAQRSLATVYPLWEGPR